MRGKDSLPRRDFLKTASAAGLGAFAATRAAGPLLAFDGWPSEKLRVAVMGLNGRGMVHAHAFARDPNTTLAYLCDVDSTVLGKALADVSKLQSPPPKAVTDFRRILEDKSVDAIAIATPDHWHAAATILALDAGKHVYVEKPSGHDNREDELIVAAARKHPSFKVQLGTQARSGPHFIEVLQLVRSGAIGNPYLARAWYSNTRGSIGHGKVVPVPANLDYELWQGQSCNGLDLYERSRGTTILGTNGSVVVDRDGYVVYDLKNQVVKKIEAAPKGDSLNTVGDDWLTQLHIDNFVSAVRTGTALSAPIEDGAKTGTLCHLGTISQQ